MAIELTLTELAAIVGVAVALSSTDAAALSRLAVTFVSKRLGIEPSEIYAVSAATSDREPTADAKEE